MKALRIFPLVAVVFGAAVACGRTDFFAPPRVAPPPEPVCGNGVLERGEDCEDGNLDDDDGCRADCTPAFCGDGVVFVDVELCDDGNTVSADGCENDCALPRCGDGITQAPEENCDDANVDNTDACLSSCLLAFCGDGFVRAGLEECDDANGLANDACIACRRARCGDGNVQVGVEECDDGNRDAFDGCTNECRRPVCGDGLVSEGEACDFGSANQNQPALSVTQNGVTRAVQPVLGARDVASFYDYSSASSHMGFEREGEGRVLLYLDRGSNSLSLILNYGIDDPGSQPPSNVVVFVEGVPASAVVLLADDRGEEFGGGGGSFAGNFSFDTNTDGGVVGPIPFPQGWRIVVTHAALEGVSGLVFINGDRSRIALDSTPIVIESRVQRAACRTDCQVPSCGDGRLDPGELCDSPDPLCGPTCGL